ncbi:hypothetical protein Ac2012v2_002434 [Leucoagaricus gongylophorus]
MVNRRVTEQEMRRGGAVIPSYAHRLSLFSTLITLTQSLRSLRLRLILASTIIFQQTFASFS